MAIRGCRDKHTEDFLANKRVREFEQCAKPARKAIARLQAAELLGDLRNPPGNRFKAIEDGRYSIRIDGKWRICFSWVPYDPIAAKGMDALMVPGEPGDVEISNHYDD
jgi:toxin HigB-1